MPLFSKKEVDVAPEGTIRQDPTFDPPPPYTEATSEKLGYQNFSNLGSSSSTAARTLHVYYESWLSRTVHILDSDRETPLYDFDCHCRRPQIVLRSPGSINKDRKGSGEGDVGAIKMNPWNAAIEIDLHGSTFPMLRESRLRSCGLHFTSVAHGGQLLRWQRKTKWSTYDHNLLDSNQQIVASITTPWAMKKAMRIELMDGAMTQDAMDEVVITGLAVWWRAIQTGAAAGASAGAVAGGAAAAGAGAGAGA